MKKTLIMLALVAMSGLTAYGQGRVTFNNQAGGNRPVTVGALNMGPAGGATGDFVGANYSVQLVWAPQAVYANQAAFDAAVLSSSPAFAFFGVTGTGPLHGPTVDGAGLFDGSNVPNPVGTSMPAGNYTMQARAWYNTGFATYQLAVNGGANTGLSALFNIAATVSPTPAQITTGANGLAAFTVGTVPEPSTLALAGLGAAAMMLFRRKK